ncbi:hypothetical protein Sa4125_30000 [Aureimonas sp. SA4125]|uniref:hypothetical protein n=1 Tax=Aureimonas sp. SA4125 TaxID=2826993 RepID=UPI001CC65E7F|nr:hypothetical protein [Aureimonas sp. SA4125]BDA85458.1 hypothetical protein Sa4125_30000 [Aureimonas sp. SA4125]
MGNAFGTTALTPPVLDYGGPVMTNTVEVAPAAPLGINQVLDEVRAFRAAEAAERRRFVQAATDTVAGLFARGQNDQAMAILWSLTRPEPFWATRYLPPDRRHSWPTAT